MSLLRKTKHRVETVIAWVLAVGIIGLLIAGVIFVAGKL